VSAYAFSDVQEGFLEAVGDLAGKRYSCNWHASNAVEVFQAYLAGYLFGVEVADFCKGIWEAWDNSQVDVVWTIFAAC
jgi:hypothetical protein